ncbi:MAG TPA: hypothetical protein PKA48_08135, partial [Candidatus Obscuribacter sp.]|nr:hypothetical protein [Candidatus Obscuribacter sp.]
KSGASKENTVRSQVMKNWQPRESSSRKDRKQARLYTPSSEALPPGICDAYTHFLNVRLHIQAD